MQGKSSSKDTILKLARGVEPGWVEIIPLNLVTFHVLTWLYSEHTETKYFSDSVTLVTGDLNTRAIWLVSHTLNTSYL